MAAADIEQRIEQTRHELLELDDKFKKITGREPQEMFELSLAVLIGQ